MLERVRVRGVPPRPEPAVAIRALGVVVAVVALATAAVAVLESPGPALSDASPVYFVAVAIAGSLLGTWPAVATALVSFLVYDLFFTQPRFTLLVQDPSEWLDLLLFVVLAVIVGRLAALGAERATEASRRAAESSALFATSRVLATEPDIETAAPTVARQLLDAAQLARVWIVTEGRAASRILADTSAGEPLPTSPFVTSLIRMPGDTPARWQRAHEPSAMPAGAPRTRAAGRTPILRVRMEADGVTVGAIKAIGRAGDQEPDRPATRLLGLAADQLGLAIRRDALRREATEVEIARQADALKSALLDAVSHDLRTPLASIRAEAGSLADADVPIEADAARRAGGRIDAEAERLDRLVREVLDLSRVESGALRPDLEAIDLAEAVRLAVDRLRPLLGERPISIDVADDLPPARADALLLDGMLTNLVENVARHAPAPAALAIDARVEGDRVEITIDDAGPGVPADGLNRLFERFHRLPTAGEGSRRGLGIGLSIVRGFGEVMGVSVRAERSPLGGLRIALSLPIAARLAAEATPASR